MATYRLPNNETTKDVKEYSREWRSLANKVLKFFPGYRLYAYDPGFHFCKETVKENGVSVVEDNLRISTASAYTLVNNK